MDVKKKLKLQKIGNITSKTLTIIFLSIMALIVIIPFYWMLNTSFKTAHEADKQPPTLYPHEWNFQNYRLAFLGDKQVTLKARKKELAELSIKKEKQEKLVASLKDNYDKNIAKFNLLEEQAKTDKTVKYSAEYIARFDTLDATGYSYYEYLKKQSIANTLTKLNDNLKHNIGLMTNELDKITDKSSAEYIEKSNKIKKLKEEYAINKDKINNISKFNVKHRQKIDKDVIEEPAFDANKKFTKAYLEVYKDVFNYQKEADLLTTYTKRFEKLPEIIKGIEKQPNDHFAKYMLNTLIVGISSTILGTFLSIIGAFALSRLKFKGRDLLFSIMMATMMIPGEMMVISNYITVTKAGWTKGSQIFPGSPFLAMVIPFLVTVFHIYLLRQNFKQIPNELYYAAKVDGCGDFKYLWRVMVPLAKSSILTITILKVMGAWNAYIWPDLVGNEQTKLITVWLRNSFNVSGDGSEGARNPIEVRMAATVIVLIPLLLVFIFLRKYIMRGVSRGGTKG